MDPVQISLIMFAGGPGLAALVMQVWKHRSEKPVRDASTAETLTKTATGLLNSMQERIDHLEDELRTAERKIDQLQAQLDASDRYAEELGQERERARLLEAENERLKALLPDQGDP